jgi:hypothetical protein
MCGDVVGDDVRRALVSAALARREDCAAIGFGRSHAAAVSGDIGLLAGADDAELAVRPRISGMMDMFKPLATAVQLGHIEVARALIARGAKVDDDDSPLDVAIRYDQEAAAGLLLDAGARPSGRTGARITATTSERLLDRLISAGLDVNDPDAGVAGRIGGIDDLTTTERIGFARRLIARGFRLDRARLLELLEEADEETLVEYDLGCAMIELAHSGGMEPDDALITFALDRLPVAALDVLARVGATFRSGAHVRSSAPDAAQKRAWLAKHGAGPSATRDTPGVMSWKDFARLDGVDLTIDTICARLIGNDRVFSDLDVQSFETEIRDEEVPATHRLDVIDKRIEYAVSWWTSQAIDDAYQKRGRVAFAALAKAIAALHGPAETSQAHQKIWVVGDRQLELSLFDQDESAENNYGRPCTEVSLRAWES